MKSGILDIVKAVLNRIHEWKASTDIDTSVDKQKYITNQVLDEHSRTPLCTKCVWDTRAHCRARFELIWTKELAEEETASDAGESALLSPDVREIESFKNPGATGQTAAMEKNTTNNRTGTRKLVQNPVVDRAGGAALQSDVSQAQPMDVSLDQKATTTAAKQRAGTQLTTNNVESGIGDLKKVAGHQAERADSMLPVEAIKYSANTIADVNHQYEHCTGKLWDRDKCFAKHFSVIRRGKKSEANEGTHVRMAAIPSENGDLVRWRLVSIEVNQYERYDGFADTQALKVFPMSIAQEQQVNVTQCTDIA